jgi:membrane protease YdiL (CAAX protease family)
LLKWRVGARWYATALLTAPLSMLAALLLLSIFSPQYLPRIVAADNKTALLLMGLAVGLLAGIFEELGWTGFAIPTLRLRYSILSTGLVVGVLWGVWHFLVNFWASGVTAGSLSLAIFLPLWIISVVVGQLTAYRILMVWVYDHTGSLLMAILMHVSLAAGTFILSPPTPGPAYWILGFAYAAAMWIVVGVLYALNQGKLSRPPLPSHAAA